MLCANQYSQKLPMPIDIFQLIVAFYYLVSLLYNNHPLNFRRHDNATLKSKK